MLFSHTYFQASEGTFCRVEVHIFILTVMKSTFLIFHISFAGIVTEGLPEYNILTSFLAMQNAL